ncbi:hypothetical protein JHK82_030125 [Glycine max]|nr:hypothetical protein JHK82_030125 [Glycine max]
MDPCVSDSDNENCQRDPFNDCMRSNNHKRIAPCMRLGNLHQLKPPIPRTLHALSQKHGPIFSLRIRGTKNDIVFANRFPSIQTKYLG